MLTWVWVACDWPRVSLRSSSPILLHPVAATNIHVFLSSVLGDCFSVPPYPDPPRPVPPRPAPPRPALAVLPQINGRSCGGAEITSASMSRTDGAAREAVTGSQPHHRQAQEWLILLIDNTAAVELVKAVTDLTSALRLFAGVTLRSCLNEDTGGRTALCLLCNHRSWAK
ncbi:hypothetical protein E2C01_000374 [Portunus trituberculatus]|uniref:Uncharacterized protein n=1 Tax=Portunus trituberculatus TaxID=210409 RepID=A0A5B7CEH9_PORTR|nr:hypothetical protein [Portunus trituberculatus]